MYEIEALISNIYRKEKSNWEQARLISYLIAQTNSTKKLKQSDILQFHWEKDDVQLDGNTSISNEDVDRLKNKATNYLKGLNNGNE